MKKICTHCKEEKLLKEFYFRKDTDKYRNECKKCLSLKSNNNYLENKDYYKIKRKKYYNENSEKYKKESKQNYYDNIERRQTKNKEYRKLHKDRLREQKKERDLKYLKENPNFKLRITLRSRIREALKWSGVQKSHKTYDLLGCDVETAKQYIQSLFLDGMSWDNHGEWHIDHIKPCASFDLTDIKQQKICFNYKNLQPLWAKDNLKKGDSNGY